MVFSTVVGNAFSCPCPSSYGFQSISDLLVFAYEAMHLCFTFDGQAVNILIYIKILNVDFDMQMALIFCCIGIIINFEASLNLSSVHAVSVDRVDGRERGGMGGGKNWSVA